MATCLALTIAGRVHHGDGCMSLDNAQLQGFAAFSISDDYGTVYEKGTSPFGAAEQRLMNAKVVGYIMPVPAV